MDTSMVVAPLSLENDADAEWYTPEERQVYRGCVVPYGYALWKNGVYTIGETPDDGPGEKCQPTVTQNWSPFRSGAADLISSSQLWIEDRATVLATGEMLAKVAWTDVHGAAKCTWASAGLWNGANGYHQLLSLANYGLDVSQANAKLVCKYLRALDWDSQQRFAAKHVATKSAYYEFGDSRGWLLGNQWLSLDSSHVSLDPRVPAKNAQAFGASGIQEAWFAQWREVRATSWVNRFLTSAMFAPPLMRYLNSRTFIVHHYGESSTGKTASAHFGLSVWGNPQKLYSSLNRTAISATEVFRYVDELPVFFDEQQVSTLNTTQFIYAMCAGAGRERSTRDGGLQNRDTWRTLVRTTGEEPLVGGNDLGGQFNRVVQLRSHAFANRAQASALYGFCERHHGFAGPMFLRHLLERVVSNRLEELRNVYRVLREDLLRRLPVMANHCDYLAVIATAQVCADVWLLGSTVEQAMQLATQDAATALQEIAPEQQETYAARAMRALAAHYFSSPSQYLDDTSPEGRSRQNRHQGVIGVRIPQGIAYVATAADKLLIREGYAPKRVWEDFQRLHWLESTRLDGRTELMLAGQLQSVYVVRNSALGFVEANTPHLQVVK